MRFVLATARPGRIAMAVLYIVAGSLHFILTAAYMRLMPDYLPVHRELVLLSGAAEIAGGLGLLAPQSRRGQPGRAAAWGLVALLIAVFPANVTLVIDPARFPQVPLWAAWLRLPLQLPLLYWAWLYTRRSAWSPPQADAQ